MKSPITLCKNRFVAETAAVSCLRYRSIYGASPMSELPGRTGVDFTAQLVKLVWVMVSPDDIDFREFSELCRGEKSFVQQAFKLRGELLRRDERYHPPEGAELITPKEFDELDIIARLAQAGLSTTLIYELPIFQLIAVMNRTFDFKQKTAKGGAVKVKMSPEEVHQLLGVKRSV